MLLPELNDIRTLELKVHIRVSFFVNPFYYNAKVSQLLPPTIKTASNTNQMTLLFVYQSSYCKRY